MPFEFFHVRSKEDSPSNERQFAATVLEGLSRKEKRLPSWLIFDDRGSEIFREITELENYHPAVCEREIFHVYKETIADIISDAPFQLVELGAGDGTKTLVLIEEFLKNSLPFHYVPIDISPGAVKNLVSALEAKYSDTSLSVRGMIADYFEGLEEFSGEKDQRSFVLFLGSTIGNQDFFRGRGIFTPAFQDTQPR